MRRSFSQLRRGGVQWLLNWTGSRDYQAPSLSPLPSDFESFFPFLVRRRSFNPWIRHTGRYDRRYPSVGFVTLDKTLGLGGAKQVHDGRPDAGVVDGQVDGPGEEGRVSLGPLSLV